VAISRRPARCGGRSGTVVTIASIVTVAGVLDAIGVYPTLRAFHDRVNAVAAPLGWVLLASLLVLVVAASVTELRPRTAETSRASDG
jgi:hypothetical protein